MAANPRIIPEMSLVPKQELSQAVESKPIGLKKRVQDLLIEIFKGHEDFLGRTPD